LYFAISDRDGLENSSAFASNSISAVDNEDVLSNVSSLILPFDSLMGDRTCHDLDKNSFESIHVYKKAYRNIDSRMHVRLDTRLRRITPFPNLHTRRDLSFCMYREIIAIFVSVPTHRNAFVT
jgi:hypothetical protein